MPLQTFGSSGGSQQSLLLPVIPDVSDGELLEHVQLIKEIHEHAASAAKQQRGDAFDVAKYRLLISALPPSARAAVEYLIVKLTSRGPGWE